MQEAGRVASKYLIVRDAENVQAAATVFGERRQYLTREQALNGSRNLLDGADILIWSTPNVQDVQRDRDVALELVKDAQRTRIMDMTVPTAEMFTPEECVKHGINHAALEQWAITCKAIIEIPKPPADEAEPINRDSPDPTLPGTSDERSDDAAAVDPPSMPLAPDESRPFTAAPDDSGPMPESLPIEAYAEEGSYSPFKPVLVESKPSHWQRPDHRPTAPVWPPEPVDFWKSAKVPEMRHEWMPPSLADLWCEEALTWGADPGIFGMFGIGTCAGALPNYIQIQVKQDSRWIKATRLWLLVNAYSGSMKSPILVAMARALEELQEELMAEVAFLQKKYIDDKDIYEKQRQKYIAARANNEPAEPPQEPEIPSKNRLIVKNATAEIYADLLSENGGRGILGIHDEIVGKITGQNQYKRGGDDMEEFLRLRDGGRHSVDRKGRVVMVQEFGMAMIGGTQPDRIRDVVRRYDLTSNGFLQRFNIYTAREATLDLDRPEHGDYERMTDIVQRLYHMQHQGPVQFSEGAREVRLAFREWAYQVRSPEWVPDSLRSHLSKYNDFFAEFCLTYHAIESADMHSAYIQPEVSEATAQRVSNLMRECLYVHAEAFYNENINGDGELLKDVRYLAEKLLAKNPGQIDLTWITQGWTKWRTFKPWQKKGILTMLMESGWISSLDPRGYVEGMTFKALVNPVLQSRFGAYVDSAKARLEEMAERRERMAD